jgi:hypothetical protein
MPKFWLSQAPTVMLECLGRLDGALRTIAEMAGPGFYPPIRRLEKPNEHDSNPREIGARDDLAQLSRTVIMEGHNDKFAQKVVFINYDRQSWVQTNIFISIADAGCFISSYLRADLRDEVPETDKHIEIIVDLHVDHLCCLDNISLPNVSFMSPAAAARVFWQCCKREFAQAVTRPHSGVTLVGKPDRGKDREIIPNELLEYEIVDAFDEEHLIVRENDPKVRVDWFNNKLAYDKLLWTDVKITAKESIFPGERARRRTRINTCIELIANAIDYNPTFEYCRCIISNLKRSEYYESRQVVKRRKRQSSAK